jgi:dTDP-4-dehydrorhamnose reductase
VERKVKRALVTGAAGMLGSEVVAALADIYEVTAADVQQFDIRNPEATRAFVMNVAPELVVNCAAYTDVDAAESDRENAFAVNASGAVNLAEAAAENGALLVQVSTDYVFDGTSCVPYREDAAPNPLGVYGRSKLAGERGVEELARDWLIVRTAWLYGHRGRNFVETILRLADEGVPLRVVSDQKGSPTNVRHLAAMIRDLVAAEARGVVNATNAGTCSWYDLAREILSLSGKEDHEVEAVTTDTFPRPAPRPRYSVLSLERLCGLIGRTPAAWQAALAEYIAER